MNYIDIEASKFLSWIYLNKYVKTTLLLLFGLYFVIAPKLPNIVSLLYNNFVFRLLVILLIIHLSMHDHQLAIMVSVVYLITLKNLNNNKENNYN